MLEFSFENCFVWLVNKHKRALFRTFTAQAQTLYRSCLLTCLFIDLILSLCNSQVCKARGHIQLDSEFVKCPPLLQNKVSCSSSAATSTSLHIHPVRAFVSWGRKLHLQAISVVDFLHFIRHFGLVIIFSVSSSNLCPHFYRSFAWFPFLLCAYFIIKYFPTYLLVGVLIWLYVQMRSFYACTLFYMYFCVHMCSQEHTLACKMGMHNISLYTYVYECTFLYIFSFYMYLCIFMHTHTHKIQVVLICVCDIFAYVTVYS